MICPKCFGRELSPAAVREGLEIDTCPSCGGVWLDKSEIYHYVSKPEQAYEEFKTAYKTAVPARECCPRCEKALRRAVIPGADLAFEACPSCGGNWFDAGEVQKLYGYLDSERQRGTGTGGEYLRALPGPRALTQEELDSWAGAGLGYRRWYIRGAQAAVGEIVSYAKEVGNRALVHVLFIYEEYPYQISRVIWFKSPLDLGVGGIVQVLAHPWYPRGAFIVAAEGAQHPWTDEDRYYRMSCESVLTDPSQGMTLLDLAASLLKHRHRRHGRWF